MAITPIDQSELLRHSRQALGLSALEDTIDEPFLANCLRRAAAIFSPCSGATLVAAVLESLAYLSPHPADLREAVEFALEGLVVTGDLLELDQVALNIAEAKNNWLFAAPPGFIARPDGSVFVIGIAPDALSALPATLQQRITHQRYVRVLKSALGEDLPALLAELGLLEHSERAWLKLPKETAAEELHREMLRRLTAQPPSGHVEDLLVLDPAARTNCYRGRWKPPRQMSGTFVARRPQAYGAPIWGFALLDHGALARFLDFPLKGFRWRGCDAAWHLQAAIDHCRGMPQRYRRRPATAGAYFDFFSPLPLWAERHLAIVGQPAARQQSLFTYFIAEDDLVAEEEFLQRRLWLNCDDNSN